MKHVMSADMVAHAWANQTQDSARVSGRNNFYFQGDTIYSYGSHFPIARLVQAPRTTLRTQPTVAVLWNDRTYSITTTRHQAIVRGACSHLPLFRVSDVYAGHKAQLAYFKEEIRKAALALSKARIKVKPLASLERAVAQANEYAKFFGLATRFAMPDVKEVRVKAEQQARAQEARQRKFAEQRAIEYAKQREIDAKEGAELREIWLNGGTVERWNMYKVGETLLRLKPGEPETVETSKGAEFPLRHGKLILAAVRSGVPYEHNGHTMHAGAFHVDSIDAEGTVRAGCHVVSRAEIERFAKSIGL